MSNPASNEMDLRDKDRALAERCNSAATASSQAVEWLDTHREPSPRISNLQKQLRRQAVEARRLGTAAARPMSVGVFGASQMGKSFLIGKLIRPKERPVDVIFGTGDDAVRQDFLSQVNPSGGDETTGLVTRFSLRSFDTPAGNPVVLRMLREVDIPKILTNTFLYDLKGQYRIQPDPEVETTEDRSLTSERIDVLAQKLEPLKQSKPQPGMSIEDVYELREYIEKNLEDHVLSQETAEGYWHILETMVPYLDGSGRVLALAPLWAELEEFNDLYSKLKGALDQLGHPKLVFTGLNALADRSRGVLHVNTLRDLDAEGSPETLAVVSDTGANVTLPMCVVTALTAELCVTLESAPWPFFTHTDLLDFPGARSRENTTVHEFLRAPSEPMARSNCFLRGKVAVLFDNYAADLDLNVMLLCAGPENFEVKSLPGLLKDWITRTHGETPAKRSRVPTGLFYCLTKCDTLFIRKVGLDDPITARFENNIDAYPWWIKEWVPGKTFDNVFLIRNPAIEDRGVFEYDPKPEGSPDDFVPPETGLTSEFQQYLDDKFSNQFLTNAMVQQHVAQPDKKLEALLELNDGGTSLLAESLAPVCNPDLKYDQILPRAETTIAMLGTELSGYYESGDLEKRLEERTARIGKLIAALRKKPSEIGPFIASFQVDASLMEAAYRQFRRSHIETPPEEDVFDALFDDAEAAETTTTEIGFGKVLIEWWARFLSEKVPDSPWCDRLGVDEETLRGFVEELMIGAERQNIAHALEARVDQFTTNTMRLDAAARRVSIFASAVLNDQLNLPHGRNPENAPGRFERNAFPPEELPEDPTAMQRLRLTYFKDWMDAIQDVTVQNASFGAGGTVDVEANSAMGNILSMLGWEEE